LLAPELAPKGITVNTICPGTIAAGMNRQMSERNQLKEAALIPMGRLCRPEDVAAAVRYLLSPQAGFISGQSVGLTGAQL
jgi:3-oxoacyl-[acyl-carrier protein] reductase